jgi:hypothetical protein
MPRVKKAPLSLAPLTVEQALRGLMQVDPAKLAKPRARKARRASKASRRPARRRGAK